MKQMILAAVCSTLVAASSLQAAAAARYVRTTPATVKSEQLRNARALLASPAFQADDMARGNAGAAPAGR